MSGSSGQKQRDKSGQQQGQVRTVTATVSGAAGKWTVVRPWQPPSSSSSSTVVAQVEGETEQPEEDAGEPDNGEMPEAELVESTTARRQGRRMQLQVVDVSSTSVSLAVVGQPEEANAGAAAGTANNETLHHQYHGNNNNQALATSLASSSSRLRQRSRSASTASNLQNQTMQSAAHMLQPNPPNISIKLNSAAWPHVFHTDSSFMEPDNPRQTSTAPSSSTSSILVWGLSPGQNYHIELGVFSDEPEDNEEEDEDLELEGQEDSSAAEDTEVQAAASVRTLDATEPDVPPPPYSSRDPSAPHDSEPSRDAEASLRAMLEKLRTQAKQAESSLQSSITALKRANDKLTREDQRHRQRIHMLEDSTARLHEVAAEEDAESANITEALSDLSLSESTLASRLTRRKDQLDELERLAKEEGERQDAEMSELKERIERAAQREEEVLSKKLKLERELLPTYNIQLATLEADVRRLLDDQRRHYAYGAPVHTFMYGGSHGLPYAGNGIASRPGSLRQSKRGHAQTMQQQGPTHLHQRSQPQMQYYDDPVYTQGGMPSTRPDLEPLSAERDLVVHQTSEGTASRTPAILPIGGHRARSTSVTSAGTASPVTAAEKPAGDQLSSNKDMDSSQRTSSRFAWGSGNSWASRVARGGGSS